MKKSIVAGAIALGFVAGVAQAAPTPAISFSTTATANPAGTKVIYDFDATPSGTQLGVNSFVTNTSAGGIAVRPAVFSATTGNYAYAGNTGNFTLAFAPTNILSFALGSLDTYNTLTLNFADLTSVVLSGAGIIGDSAITSARRDGVVTYTIQSGPSLISANFASTQNSFEIDNVAVAVPEPAAWGMMILGFGLVGGVLRRRTTAKVKFA